MHTSTIEITFVSKAEFKTALRPSFTLCGLDVDKLHFAIGPNQLFRVASNFDLDSPSIGTLLDVIRDSPPHKDWVDSCYIQEWIAMLTDESQYGENAWPKTDYIFTSS